ncbi:hypothetical protein Esti_004342 [Eimeria stiedai]
MRFDWTRNEEVVKTAGKHAESKMLLDLCPSLCLCICSDLCGSKGKKKEKNSVKTEEYEVDDIISHKKERGLDFFRVRWKGFDESDDTWEVEGNLAHAPMFHAKMNELKKQTEQKLADKEAEAAALAHAKKRRRPAGSDSDPSRPCDVEAQAEDEEGELRIYPTGTKVPKNHLPDEVALGNRLSILRFKRSVQSGVRGSKDGGQEEGHDISVTYTIDGTDTYTIPFNAARRYCCQRLLSYLIRRTTFRSPRGCQEASGEGGGGSTSCAGSSSQQSSCEGGVAASVQREFSADQQKEARAQKRSAPGETNDDEGERRAPPASSLVGMNKSSSSYLPGLKVLKGSPSPLNASAESSTAPQNPAEPRLVDAV